MKIYIDNRQKKVELNSDINDIIEEVIKSVLLLENKSLNYEISVSLVDNQEIKELNKDYRNMDKETDVLSFPMEDDFNLLDTIILGDIIISIEKALEQSQNFSHSLYREISYLTAHSMLHLLGYDHMNDEDKRKMRQKEKDIMKEIKLFKSIKGE